MREWLSDPFILLAFHQDPHNGGLQRGSDLREPKASIGLLCKINSLRWEVGKGCAGHLKESVKLSESEHIWDVLSDCQEIRGPPWYLCHEFRWKQLQFWVGLNDDHCALDFCHSWNIKQCSVEPWGWCWGHRVKEMALHLRSTGGHCSSGASSGLAFNVDISHCLPWAQSHLSSTRESTVIPAIPNNVSSLSHDRTNHSSNWNTQVCQFQHHTWPSTIQLPTILWALFFCGKWLRAPLLKSSRSGFRSCLCSLLVMWPHATSQGLKSLHQLNDNNNTCS